MSHVAHAPDGADDPFISAADMAAFNADLNAGKVDWTLVEYADAAHSFTNPKAGNDKTKAAAYHERSSKRAFKAMRLFFDELFAGG